MTENEIILKVAELRSIEKNYLQKLQLNDYVSALHRLSECQKELLDIVAPGTYSKMCEIEIEQLLNGFRVKYCKESEK